MAASSFSKPDRGVLRGSSSVLGEPSKKNAALDLVNSPANIADRLSASIQNSLPGMIFPHVISPSGVSLYSEISPGDLKLGTSGRRSDLGEYPLVKVAPGDLQEARTDDIGLKNVISDKALETGDASLLGSIISLQHVSIQQDLNSMMLTALEGITGEDGPGHVLEASSNWMEQSYVGDTPTPERLRPWADLVTAKRVLRNHGLAAQASHLIVDEETADALAMVHGPGLLTESWGVTVLASNEIEPGTGYLVAAGGFGNLVTRAGLQVETWRDPSIRGWYVQSYCEPVVVIHRPVNAVKLVGLHG